MEGLWRSEEPSHLFKRKECKDCPKTPPSCKTLECPTGLTCVISIQTCDTCAEVKCENLVSSGGGSKNQVQQPQNKPGAPIGAIVGGVMGFLVVCCIAAFFLIRKNKKKQKAEYEASVAAWAVEKENSSYRDPRASTQTVGSIASTVFTRASNVIQIAYIPGVTAISNPGSPGHLGVPPVPSIPGQHVSQASGDHFFSADDIARQSVWSTHSGLSIGTADPRASVATTIYRSNAIVSPLAATATVVRAKAAVVTVKNSPAPSGASSPRSADDSPPMPSTDFSKYGVTKQSDGLLSPNPSDRGPASPAFSVGSTFLNKMTMATVPEEPSRRTSTATTRSKRGDPSPFSDRNSIDMDTVAPLRTTAATGRSSPARHMEGDIRMSFRPISEVGSEAGDSPSSPNSRGKSPFGDEHRVNK